MTEALTQEQTRLEVIAYYEDKIGRVQRTFVGLHELRDELQAEERLQDEDKARLKQQLLKTWLSLFGKSTVSLATAN